jgi:hypothetical protein
MLFCEYKLTKAFLIFKIEDAVYAGIAAFYRFLPQLLYSSFDAAV